MTRVNIVDSTLERDMRSRGLVETDSRKRDEYRVKRKLVNNTKNQYDEITKLKNDISDLQTSISELKELIKGLK